MNSIKEEVTQADIDAAEVFEKSLRGRMLMTDRACFAVWCAEAFARHRIEATRPLTAEIADLRAQLDEAMEALGKAQQWFAEYAESHSEKAKIAGDNEREYEARRQKARTNEQRSEYLRAILTKRKQP